MDDLWWVETKGRQHVDEKRGLSIDEVKKRVPISALLAFYGGDDAVKALSLDGSLRQDDWRSIRCPFHKDNRPSASVNPKRGRFRCHTCDVGGDVVDVVSQHEAISTKEALEWIRLNLL